MAERQGFEPPVSFGYAGFQDRSDETLGHLAGWCGTHGRELAATGWFTARLQTKSLCLAEAARQGHALAWRQRWARPRRLVSECTVICFNPILSKHQLPTRGLADCLDLGTSTRLLAFFQRGEAIGMYDE